MREFQRPGAQDERIGVVRRRPPRRLVTYINVVAPLSGGDAPAALDAVLHCAVAKRQGAVMDFAGLLETQLRFGNQRQREPSAAPKIEPHGWIGDAGGIV